MPQPRSFRLSDETLAQIDAQAPREKDRTKKLVAIIHRSYKRMVGSKANDKAAK